MTIDHNQLALGHLNRLPLPEILATHNLTIDEYHDWVFSPQTQNTLARVKAVRRSHAPDPDELRAIAIQGLVNLATSGKTTEAVRKACHDLRDAADEIQREHEYEQDRARAAQAAASSNDPDTPNADPTPRIPTRRRTFKKENLPRYLHDKLEQLNESPPSFQPGRHNMSMWGFDPDDPKSIEQLNRDYGY